MHKLMPALTLLVAACSSNNPANDPDSNPTLDTRISTEVALAITKHDYRLIAFTGRRITIPGLSPENMKSAQNICGTKFMADTGDVIRSEQERMARKYKYEFAAGYNRQIYRLCIRSAPQ
jgi:hypothetical protein